MKKINMEKYAQQVTYWEGTNASIIDVLKNLLLNDDDPREALAIVDKLWCDGVIKYEI